MTWNNTAQVNGFDIDVITLENDFCRVVLTNLGARLLELHVPDRNGSLADVVLGRGTLDETAVDPNYMGSTAGRYANRIRAGRFSLDGKVCEVTRNEGSNHLHGGKRGFDRQIWSTQHVDGNHVSFWRVSPDGEEGFPGTLTTQVTYRLEGRTLEIDIEATTDRTTVANIVNHAYFNLAGHSSGSVLDHIMQLNSTYYVPVDEELLPTGEVRAVEGTPFDFRAPTPIGKNIEKVSHSGAGRALTDAGAGYDHNWVLDGHGLREVASIIDPNSGRRLTLSTNQPGVQIYTGGYLQGVSAKAPAGRYSAFAGFTLETQTFPDAVNHSHFPAPVLRPDERYLNSIRLEFSTA
ncbi:galactose mutarotase [Actinomadura madurae]|uniref:aldose epimerase family protein n=1 Tax=Actinomadura madurae TaxID=1993 RepID=UPI002027384E|nr:aldose epimerase family protein [Actinomadura madurae]URN07282.1 galactose mutarotase [Actinomadura madurae]